MTIREHFQHSYKRMRLFTFVGVGVLVILSLWVYPHATRMQHLIGGLLLGVVVAIVLLPVTDRLFVCPRCAASFRELRRKQLGRFNADTREYWELWDKCPQCGLSFDDPWPD